MINDIVQKEPADALDPKIAGSLAAIGIVKGKPFKPDARMKKILTDAAAIGSATGRTSELECTPGRGVELLPRVELDEPALSGWLGLLVETNSDSATDLRRLD